MALANTVGDRSLLPPPKIRSTFFHQTVRFFIVLNNEEHTQHSFSIAGVFRKINTPIAHSKP